MSSKTWHPDMTDKETADLAYWERNMLALYYADGWYNDDADRPADDPIGKPLDGLYFGEITTSPRFPGWRRVLSLNGGKITFHIPDDFDVGGLAEISPTWDGHTTEEKWRRIGAYCGVKP